MTIRASVAISEVKDGSMYNPSQQDDELIITNRTQWFAVQGIDTHDTARLRISYDTDDFCRYRIVDDSNKNEGMSDGNVPFADALVTATPDLALFLPVADCVAATLFDEEHGVLMLSHLGRHSLEQQGGVKSVAFLTQHFGTRPETVKVWLGPAPSKAAYPIFKLDGQGMKEAVFNQLQQAGVNVANIDDNKAETDTDERYFSYSEFLKGNKPEGRIAMVAVMRETS